MATAETSTNHAASTSRPQASQVIAAITGVGFTLIGAVGFAVTGMVDFAEPATGRTLLAFELNPLQNILHLITGLAGLWMWRSDMTARVYGGLVFAAYGALCISGFYVANTTSESNFLSLNTADNWLHLAAALLGLTAAFMQPTKDKHLRS